MLAFKQLVSREILYASKSSFILQTLIYQFERNGMNFVVRKFKGVFLLLCKRVSFFVTVL